MYQTGVVLIRHQYPRDAFHSAMWGSSSFGSQSRKIGLKEMSVRAVSQAEVSQNSRAVVMADSPFRAVNTLSRVLVGPGMYHTFPDYSNASRTAPPMQYKKYAPAMDTCIQTIHSEPSRDATISQNFIRVTPFRSGTTARCPRHPRRLSECSVDYTRPHPSAW